MRSVLALSVAVIVIVGGCSTGDEISNRVLAPSRATVATLDVPVSATVAEAATSRWTTVLAVQPADEPLDNGDFISPEATSVPVELSPESLKLFDGLLLSVYVDVRFEDGGEGGASPVVGVADGRAWMVRGRWCAWEYSRALNAFDGSYLFENESMVACAAGETFRSAPWVGTMFATAQIEDRRVALVAGRDSLQYLDIDTLEYQNIFDLTDEDGFPLSASYGNDRWVVVFSLLEGDQEQQASRRIVFLDPAGNTIVEENNPFPEFGANSGPRAAAVTSDGRMLAFSAEEEDGSSLLVLWNLDLDVEAARYPLIGPFVPGDDPYGWGREYVSSIDISNDRILVNVSAADSEHHPSRALLVDFDGNVVDLSAQSDLAISAAAFLETRVLPNTR